MAARLCENPPHHAANGTQHVTATLTAYSSTQHVAVTLTALQWLKT